MSAIIDRESAARVINEAEATIEQTGEKFNKIINDLYNLSTVVKSKTGTTMYKAMTDFYNDLKTIGNDLESKFTGSDGVNNTLMQLINNSADTDSGFYSLTTGAFPTVQGTMPQPHDVLTGIGELGDIANILQSYSNNLSELETVFTDTINKYKELYDLAQEGPYEAVQDNAHNAAEVVRGISQSVNNHISEFSSQFNEHIDYWAQKNNQYDAASKAAIDVCKNIASDCVISLPKAE